MRMVLSVTDDASFGMGAAAAFAAVSRSDAVAAGFCAVSGTASTHAVKTMVPTLMMPLLPAFASVTDCEEPGSDDGTARRTLAGLGRRRSRGQRTVLGLKEIRDVLLRVHCDGLGPTHRRNRG